MLGAFVTNFMVIINLGDVA